MKTPVLADIFVYPLKSARGIRLSEAEIGDLGPKLDRRWMLVGEDGKVISQREQPRMALLEVAVEEDELRVGTGERVPLRIPLEPPTGEKISVDMLGSRIVVRDGGSVAAEWFSAFLGVRCRLAGVSPETVRPVDPGYGPGGHTTLTDGYPFLLLSEESLEELNQRLAEPLRMNRFRPNLVVRGGGPYAEDRWRRFRAGGVTFNVVKPCPRCVVTTVDQERGAKGGEPLRTLATYRRFRGRVYFGQNVVHSGRGTLEAGSPIELLETGDPRPDFEGAEEGR